MIGTKKLGQKFKQVTIIDSVIIDGFTHYVCKCDCGNEVIMPASSWKHVGRCKECRKKDTEKSAERRKAYTKWKYMNNKVIYKDKTFDPIWNTYDKFVKWMEDNNIPYNAKMSIDKGCTIFSPYTVHFAI